MHGPVRTLIYMTVGMWTPAKPARTGCEVTTGPEVTVRNAIRGRNSSTGLPTGSRHALKAFVFRHFICFLTLQGKTHFTSLRTKWSYETEKFAGRARTINKCKSRLLFSAGRWRSLVTIVQLIIVDNWTYG